jgi:glycosyltransferase involved in cell wall biosynthesis
MSSKQFACPGRNEAGALRARICVEGLKTGWVLLQYTALGWSRRAFPLRFLQVLQVLSSRRGSALAGIACGLPVVGYRSEETAFPVTEAGVVLVAPRDRVLLAEALVRVLADDDWRQQLRTRSRAAQEQYFSWEVISGLFLDMLGGVRTNDAR